MSVTRKPRALVALLAILALLSFANLALAQSGGKSSERKLASGNDAATFHDETSRSSIEYAAARVAPGTDVAPGAFAAARASAAALASTGGAWTEVTNKPYDSDAHGYRDPVFSNSGGGSGLVTGRMTALAVQASGTLWAGAADGGVWKSTDNGTTWSAKFDSQASLSIGAIGVDPAPGGKVWVGTGENNTAFENYRGAGVFVTTNGDAWTLVGDGSVETLDGTTIGKIAFGGNHMAFAATSRGLFKHSTTTLSGAWIKIFDATTFGYAPIPYGLSLVNDVVVRPGTNGQYIVANMAWRNGTAYDGFYISTDGGNTFAQVKAGGAINDGDLGRSSFAYSADGAKLYAVVESPFQINHFTQNGGTVLQGVFVSNSGDASGPWNKIAESRKLAGSGSALPNCCSKGYMPGVQAWYNQFIGVDPADSDHVYLGLEEVFETTNGGSGWNAIGPYWNFGLPCSANGLDSCPKTTHPDQHAIAFANGTVYVGNDGGIWSRSTANHEVAGWNDLNATLRTLQYYYAGAGKVPGGTGDMIWGGLQDNGQSLIAPFTTPYMVSPFGGDGGDTLVDPANGDRVVVEYVDLDMALTTTAGRSDGSTVAWTEISPSCFAFTYTPSPCDPNARFIAPFRADTGNINHWVAGGQYVWDNQNKGWETRCSSSACDWKIQYNTGAGHSTTAIAVNGGTTYAAWCGPSGCNPSVLSTVGAGFSRGIATNYSTGGPGLWHELNMGGLPNRYVTALTVDPANAGTVYAVFGGFSRRWIPTAGVGHVFKTMNGGASWTDISGALPDAPGDDLVIKGTNLYLATDVGVFTSSMATPSVWSRFGTGLPNASVNDLSLAPDGTYLIGATHGRGIWKISLP